MSLLLLLDFFEKPIMSSTVVNRRGLTLYDVSTQTTKKSITALIKKRLSNVHWELARGNPYRKYLSLCLFMITESFFLSKEKMVKNINVFISILIDQRV
jgi:hypothetical protein